MYPVGCILILGLPLAVLHQMSSPVDFKYESCGNFFGTRTLAAKIALGLLFAVPVGFVAVIFVKVFLRS